MVFGDDVRRPDGRVVPGWKPGDRISFVDGTTRVSEVIMGYTLKASATAELTVEPILGRRDNGIMANVKSMVEASEKTGRKALLAPPRKVPKETLEKVADARFGDTSSQWRKDIAADLQKSWNYMNKSSEFSIQSQKYSAQASEHSQASYRYSDKSREFSEASLEYSKKSLGYSQEAQRHSEASLQASRQSSKYSNQSQVFSQEAKGHSSDANDLSLKAKSFSEAAGASAEDAEKWRARAEEARRLAENARSGAETARAQAESERNRAETARAGAESERSKAETARSSAEKARSLAESERSKAEAERNSAEKARERAENARSDAEGSRREAVTNAVKAATSATQAAMSATDAAYSAKEKAEAAEQIAKSNQRAIAMEALGHHGQWTLSSKVSIPGGKWITLPFSTNKGKIVGCRQLNYTNTDNSYIRLDSAGDWQFHCRFHMPAATFIDTLITSSEARLKLELRNPSGDVIDEAIFINQDQGWDLSLIHI